MGVLPTYIPSPPRGVWHLGPLPVRAYAVCIITGIIVALLIGDRRLVARGGERGMTYDIALWAVPFGLIGGRLYHLATDWQTYFGDDGAGLGAAMRIWDGGLGIWGAIALGVVGAWIGCRRRGIPLPVFLDAVAPGVVLAQAIGRLGNYFNQELYGRETVAPWGLEIFYRRDPTGFIDVHSLDGVSTGQVAFVVQPTFLYELIWNVLVFAALIYIDRRFTIGHGRLFGFYVALYCMGRFCVELLRDDPATLIAGIRINSFTSTFVFIGAVVYILLAPKGREDRAALGGSEYVAGDSLESQPAAELASVASGSAATAVGPVAPGESDQPDDAAETRQSAEPAEPETTKAQAPDAVTEKAEVAEPETDLEAEGEEAELPGAEAEAEAVEPEASEAEAEELETAEPEAQEVEVTAPEAQEGVAAESEAAESAAEAEAAESEVVEAGVAEVAEESEPDIEREEAGDSAGEAPAQHDDVETALAAVDEPGQLASEVNDETEPEASSEPAELHTEQASVQSAEAAVPDEPDEKGDAGSPDESAVTEPGNDTAAPDSTQVERDLSQRRRRWWRLGRRQQ
ncbi:prolipoprotein diacylglyceryl transferase [Mycobacterium decipiens]|uniref:Phosphatidylglycerol--prolipoprotein diacylglyceryl transferase n=1 Tax=Mycobacterium decipiens TaxID=1430326 RepID=A0A1X2LVY8_9MYCO|nr:prolipoprotein diacylglyceryl transferase [Mycobacterium decipiens]OSC41282.1 prolipoprotein diacylglyceryl transferase [Mycobacterium decipiens]